MGYRGIVKDQVVVLDKGVTLQEGTLVEVNQQVRQPEGASLKGWRTQVASDVGDEVFDVELLNATGDLIAQVLRCDADQSIIVSTFADDSLFP